MFQTDATSLPRLMNCNGSRLMGASNVPVNLNDPAIQDGIAAHDLAYRAMRAGKSAFDFINERMKNNVFVTQDMATHTQYYIEEISKHNSPLLEYELVFGNDFFTVHGRADCIAFDVESNVLTIDDFKFGYRIVEPDHNYTLISHAIAFCIAEKIHPNQINFIIHQPRARHHLGPRRTWSISYEQLTEFYTKICNNLSNLSDDLHTGKHCHRCPALTNCPAARIAEMNIIDISEKAFRDDLSNDEIAEQIKLLEKAKSMLTSNLDAIKEIATHRIMQGEIVKNCSVEQMIGNNTWKRNVNPDLVKSFCGIDVRSDKMVTPKQALTKGVPETFVKAMTYRPETGKKLICQDADKIANQIFNKGKTNAN